MRVNINRDKAGTMGATVRDIAETLQYGLSGQRMGYFYMNGKQYEILGQINRQQRNTPANIKSIYIRSDKGEMIQLDNLVEFVESVAPPKLYHYNRFISATVSAGLADGKTIGQGLEEMDKIAAQTLDETFRTALSGDSKDYRESSSSLMFAFILALILIYLILAAQFESFKDPLIIMLTVNVYKVFAYFFKLSSRYGAVVQLYKPLARCGKAPPYNYISVIIGCNARVRQSRGGCIIKLTENGGYLGGIAPRAYKFL